MDDWIVAAAAGAGYVVQNLKNLSRGSNKILNLSSENIESCSIKWKVGDKRCPLHRVLSWKKNGEGMSRERENACEPAFDSETATASTNGCEIERLAKLDRFASNNILSNSNSLAAFSNNEDVSNTLPSDCNGVFTGDSLTSEVGFGYAYGRKRRSSLKRRINSRFIEPQTSLGSCVMAQLYEEHAETEERTYSLYPLERSTLLPFLVSDGSRIISYVPYESSSEAYAHGKKAVCGVPGLPSLAPVELQKKAKTGNRKERALRRNSSSKIEHGNHDRAQDGTSDRTLLFCLGVAMGIVSSFLANKQEAEKFKNMLKQNENLVQDLQEELVMKDSLTVKELSTEDYESQDVYNDGSLIDTLHASPLEQNFNERYRDQKAGEKSFSNIEAELEAELQRLESNMNSSSLKGKLRNLTLLDSDLTWDSNDGSLVYSDRDGSQSSTPRSAQYPISPRELSLRLHQLLQSRLQERVTELETALENSQRWGQSSKGSCSPQDSPIDGNEQLSVVQPVIISLSGEALAAYNDSFEDFSKSDDEVGGFENVRMDRHSGSVGKQETMFEEDDCWLSNDIECSSRDEDGDDDDEVLIGQIVEKVKQGSPALSKAQRELLVG